MRSGRHDGSVCSSHCAGRAGCEGAGVGMGVGVTRVVVMAVAAAVAALAVVLLVAVAASVDHEHPIFSITVSVASKGISFMMLRLCGSGFLIRCKRKCFHRMYRASMHYDLMVQK